MSVYTSQTIDLQFSDSLFVSLRSRFTRDEMAGLRFEIRWSHFDQPTNPIRVFVRDQNVASEPAFIRLDDLARERRRERSHPLGGLNRRQRFALLHSLADIPKTDRRDLSATRLRDIGHAESRNVAIEANPYIALDVVGQVFGDIAGVENHSYQSSVISEQ